jgi:hypothetical protein
VKSSRRAIEPPRSPRRGPPRRLPSDAIPRSRARPIAWERPRRRRNSPRRNQRAPSRSPRRRLTPPRQRPRFSAVTRSGAPWGRAASAPSISATTAKTRRTWLLACFGYPAAYEDARRAACAGLGLLDDLKAIGGQFLHGHHHHTILPRRRHRTARSFSTARPRKPRKLIRGSRPTRTSCDRPAGPTRSAASVTTRSLRSSAGARAGRSRPRVINCVALPLTDDKDAKGDAVARHRRRRPRHAQRGQEGHEGVCSP